MYDRRWRGNPIGAVMPAVYPAAGAFAAGALLYSGDSQRR